MCNDEDFIAECKANNTKTPTLVPPTTTAAPTMKKGVLIAIIVSVIIFILIAIVIIIICVCKKRGNTDTNTDTELVGLKMDR